MALDLQGSARSSFWKGWLGQILRQMDWWKVECCG